MFWSITIGCQSYKLEFAFSIFDDVASEYSDISNDMVLGDAITMWLFKNLQYFDVIVASKLFGDIITDLASML